jgi:hypothetical protein
LDEGEDGDGEAPAEEGVSEEPAEEAEHEGGAHEVGDDVGGLGAGQVHGARQVRHQVHGDAHGGQPLAQLDPQRQRRRHPPAGARLVGRAAPVVHRVLHQAAAAVRAPRQPLLHFLLPLLINQTTLRRVISIAVTSIALHASACLCKLMLLLKLSLPA